MILLMSGCVRRIHHIPIDMTDENETKPTGVLYTQGIEARYKLKPEPYSIDSNKSDPELLGPQTTMKDTVKPDLSSTKPEKKVDSVTGSMTKSECISMIGDEKFKRYSKRFGGESGAIKRCAILKKLKRG